MVGLLLVGAMVGAVLWSTQPPAPKPWTDVDPQAWMRLHRRDA